MKRVLLDCDGVLSNFSQGICDVVNLITGRDTKPSDITQWDFCKALELDEHDTAAVKRKLNRTEFWENLEPCEGAVDAVKALQYQAEVYVVTTPWYSCEGWESARREWLYRHFNIDREYVLAGSAKRICTGDVFVDDKPENVRAWQDANPNGLAVLRLAPYNRASGWPGHVADSWDQIVKLVKDGPFLRGYAPDTVYVDHVAQNLRRRG